MNNNQNNKILYGIGGILIGLILAGVFYPMMRYGGYGMMNWRNNSSYDQRVTGNNQGQHHGQALHRADDPSP